MKIGSVSENQNFEKRISITPDIVKKYISLGFEIFLNENYGSHLGIDDKEYLKLGVKFKKKKDEILQSADLIVQLGILSDEKLSIIKNDQTLIGVFNPHTQDKLLLVSKFGKGFISIAENMITNQKKGKNIFRLKNGDELLKVHFANKDHLALVSKNEKLLIFDISSLPTLNKGSGVQLMKIKSNDSLSDCAIIDINEGLSWSKGSKIKNLKEIEFWIGKRAQVGKKIPKGFNKNLKFNI